MPSSIVQGIFEFLLQGFMEIVCYFIGRIVVPIVTSGRWKCGDFASEVSRHKRRAGGFYYVEGRQVYLTAEATQLAGLLTLCFAVGCGVLIWYFQGG